MAKKMKVFKEVYKKTRRDGEGRGKFFVAIRIIVKWMDCV